MSNSLEAVIFAPDGTLFDHHGSAMAALVQWLPQFGAPATEDLLTAWFAADSRELAGGRGIGNPDCSADRRRRGVTAQRVQTEKSTAGSASVRQPNVGMPVSDLA